MIDPTLSNSDRNSSFSPPPILVGVQKFGPAKFLVYVSRGRWHSEGQQVCWCGAYPTRGEAELAAAITKTELILILEGAGKIERLATIADLFSVPA